MADLREDNRVLRVVVDELKRKMQDGFLNEAMVESIIGRKLGSITTMEQHMALHDVVHSQNLQISDLAKMIKRSEDRIEVSLQDHLETIKTMFAPPSQQTIRTESSSDLFLKQDRSGNTSSSENVIMVSSSSSATLGGDEEEELFSMKGGDHKKLLPELPAAIMGLISFSHAPDVDTSALHESENVVPLYLGVGNALTIVAGEWQDEGMGTVAFQRFKKTTSEKKRKKMAKAPELVFVAADSGVQIKMDLGSDNDWRFDRREDAGQSSVVVEWSTETLAIVMPSESEAIKLHAELQHLYNEQHMN